MDFHDLHPEIPNYVDQRFDDGFALCLSFNKWGTALAVGCHDGRIVLHDMESCVIDKVLIGHVKPVSSVAWSPNGRFLLSSSYDCTVMLWNVVNGEILYEIHTDSPVIIADFCPKKDKNVFAYCTSTDFPRICTFTINDECKVSGEVKECSVLQKEFSETLSESQKAEDLVNGKKRKRETECTKLFALAFDRTGSKLFLGNHSGMLFELETDNFTITRRLKLSSAIKEIEVSHSNNWILLNMSDKCLRLISLATFTAVNDYHENISNLPWRKCCFSADDSYILGGAGSKTQHILCLWNRSTSVYEAALESAGYRQEGIVDVEWDPIVSHGILATVTSRGNVCIWRKTVTEHWSAYAPGFVEIDDNVVYDEREDEFDIIPEQKKESKEKDELADVQIDIIGDDKNENDNELTYLPAVPIPDILC